MYGNLCFENIMKNSSNENNCECPSECESISYSFRTVSVPLDPEELCPTKAGSNDFLMKPFYTNKSPPDFIRRLIKAKNNVSDDAMDYCKRNLEYRAEVIFRLATDSMSVTVMSRRLSFFDKMSAFGKDPNWFLFLNIVSNLGGTLGLFTGISILSMTEVAFWIFRYLINRMGVPKDKTRVNQSTSLTDF